MRSSKLGILLGLSAAVLLGTTRAQELEELASRLAMRPNEPGLHMQVAKAYFDRGAQDDARRVRRHIDRAVALNPAMEDDARELLTGSSGGVRRTALDAQEQLVDQQIQATLPTGGGGRNGRDAEAVIQAGLATRMVDRDLDTPLTSYEGARDEFSEIMGWGDDESDTDWGGRIAEIQGRPKAQGWQANWQEAIFGAVQRFNTAGPGGRTAPPSAPSDAGPKDSEGELIPDPMTVKNEAVIDYAEGRVEEAVEKLIETVAAAEVERNIGLAAAEAMLDDEEVEEDPPPAVVEEEPEKEEPEAEPEEEADEEEPEEAPAAPSTEQPQRTPPELAREVGQAALETLEAMANPDVEPEEVTAKVAETAAVGAVGEPLVLDWNGNAAPDLHGDLLPDGVVETAGSVTFDMDGDGHAEWCEWIQPGKDGLLAVDLDGDGRITSGRELFGTAHGDRDGFVRLSVFDTDGDGWVQGAEARTLLLWVDDGDGVSQDSELRSLLSAGVRAVSWKHSGGAAEARTTRGTRLVWEWLPDSRPRPPVGVADALRP